MVEGKGFVGPATNSLAALSVGSRTVAQDDAPRYGFTPPGATTFSQGLEGGLWAAGGIWAARARAPRMQGEVSKGPRPGRSRERNLSATERKQKEGLGLP
jgi:hypothetical protein